MDMRNSNSENSEANSSSSKLRHKNSSVKYGSAGNEKANTYTVEEAIEASGFGWFQFKILMIGGGSWIAESMEIMTLSLLGPVLTCEWGIDAIQVSFITVAVFTGFMVGAPLLGTFGDVFGRKMALLFVCAWGAYFGIISGFSPNYGWLLALRAITGFGLGGAPQSVTYVSEFLPKRYRGKGIVLMEVFWALGAMLEVALAIILLIPFGWRPWLMASAVPLVLFFPLFYVLPESPRFSLIADKYDEAQETLELIAKTNKVSLPSGTLVAEKHEKRGEFLDLFQPKYRKSTILIWGIWFCGAFGYYGVVLLSTELIRLGSTCPDAVYQITDGGCLELTIDDYISLLVTSSAEIPALVMTGIFVDTLGRKQTMILELFAYSIFTFCLFICQSGTWLTITLFLSRAFIASGYQVVYVYTPEFYPTSLRAVAMGWACSMARVGAIITPFIAQVLLGVSIYGCIAVYGVFGLIGTICAYLLPFDTKGRDLEN